jgi:DNA ligase-1
MSEKLDGVRAYWDGRRFLSRQGNIYMAPDWFVAGLPEVPLDGELWIGRKAFQRTVSIARQQVGGEHWRELRYVVFDAPAHGGEFEARLRFLDDLLRRHGPEFVQVMEHQQCRSMDQLRAEADRIYDLGGEGLMLRQPGSKYVGGRSGTLLKVKRFHDAEARVIGHEPGEGRHKGRMGALVVELANGTRFSVGTGFSDAERNNPPPIGSVISFRYQELTDAGVPRFPSYLGLRRDAELTPVVSTPAVAKRAVKASVPAAPPPAAVTAETRTFEYRSAGGVRIWEVTRSGTQVTMRFGPEGDLKQSKTTPYASEASARAAVEELIADKLDDGFVERGTAPAPAAAAPKPAPPPAPAPTAPIAGGRRHFEYVEGTSNKFWEVWVEGVNLYTHYGRIGSKGQTTIKNYPDEAAAQRAADKLIAEKTGKGYIEKK